MFGYLDDKEVVVSRGRTLCTSGEGGSARTVVSRILCAVRGLVDGKNIPTAITHTISARTKIETGTIRSTIARIEKETGKRAKKNWLRQHTNGVRALFVAKMDEIDIQKLHKILPVLEERLQAQGYGIYSIDYTRDFSGTLDRKKTGRISYTQTRFPRRRGICTSNSRRNTHYTGQHR